MSRVLFFLSLMFFFFGCSSPPPPMNFPPPSYEVIGIHIEYEAVQGLDSPIQATWKNGFPTIQWDVFRWEQLTSVEQVFSVAHEACHFSNWDYHVSHRREGELEADCCAVKWMRKSNYLTAIGLAELVNIVSEYNESEEGHPPGDERAVNVFECGLQN